MGNKVYRKYTGEHSATKCCITDWGFALRTQQELLPNVLVALRRFIFWQFLSPLPVANALSLDWSS